MRIRFKDKKLEKLYTDEEGVKKYPSQVIDKFFDLMSIIDSAKSERDFYALKSLHFEKLSGKRSHQRSMRLNKQWRLVLEIEKDDEGKLVVIIDIEDYH